MPRCGAVSPPRLRASPARHTRSRIRADDMVVAMVDEFAGADGFEDVEIDQIVERLAWTPRERLDYLLDMLAFEERAHRARRIPAGS